MDKLIAVVLIAFLVTGCGPKKFPHEFKPQNTLKIHIMSKEDINHKKIKYADVIKYNRVEGFSIWKIRKGKMIPGTCEIFTPPPNTVAQIDTLLHEIMHCQIGRFH
jgi:hypothetical protein